MALRASQCTAHAGGDTSSGRSMALGLRSLGRNIGNIMNKKQLQKLHKNDSKKATKKELDCLKAYKNYLTKKNKQIIAEWRTVRTGFRLPSGAYIAHNNDLFSKDKEGKKDGLGFDIALVVRYKSIVSIHLIQIKSIFDLKYYKQIQAKYSDLNAFAYLAVYGGKVPKVIKAGGLANVQPERIKLLEFELVRV